MILKITYKRTSKVTMRVTQKGEIHVSAPYGYSQAKIESLVNENMEWARRTFQKIQERKNNERQFFDKLPLNTREQCEDAVARLNAIIMPLLDKYTKLMGVQPSSVTYKRNTSQWGNCNVRTKRIVFSVYLLLLPDWCIEHTVVHELAHLIVPNHGPQFHKVMDIYFPRWKEARKETRRICKMEGEGDDE